MTNERILAYKKSTIWEEQKRRENENLTHEEKDDSEI